jgi:hypothetical protein
MYISFPKESNNKNRQNNVNGSKNINMNKSNTNMSADI